MKFLIVLQSDNPGNRNSRHPTDGCRGLVKFKTVIPVTQNLETKIYPEKTATRVGGTTWLNPSALHPAI